MNGRIIFVATLVVAGLTLAFQVVPGAVAPLSPTATQGGVVGVGTQPGGARVNDPPAIGATVMPVNPIVRGFFEGHANAIAGPCYVQRNDAQTQQRLLFMSSSTLNQKVGLTIQNLGDGVIEMEVDDGNQGAVQFSVDARQGRTIGFFLAPNGEIRFTGNSGASVEFLWSLKELDP